MYEKTHRYLKNEYEFFDTLKTKDCKIRGICNLLITLKFYQLERSSPLTCFLLLRVGHTIIALSSIIFNFDSLLFKKI